MITEREEQLLNNLRAKIKTLLVEDQSSDLIASFCQGLLYVDWCIVEMLKKEKPKYRVGKSKGRAILESETGKEYIVFPEGSKQEHVNEFCDWLNNKE